MIRRGLMLVLLMLIGCAPPPAADSEEPPPPATDTNFSYLAEILAGVTDAGEVLLYEGLPSAFWEPDLRARELRDKDTIAIRDYAFYDGEPELPAARAARLTERFGAAKSYAPYTSEKKCGGFSPEWCLVWKRSESITEALICLDCGEVKLYGPHAELHCDLTPEALHQLKSLLAADEQ